MIALSALTHYCDELLAAGSFEDYCPNGLQIEGRGQVARLVSGVTASQALIEAAIAAGADALLVHHGLFWKGEDPRLLGIKGRRVGAMMRADLSLLAYHLPLDAHPELGNNRRLADLLGLIDAGPGEDRPVPVWIGRLPKPMPATALADRIAEGLRRRPLHVAGREGALERVAWCTGAAQGFIERAAALGADCYISGEVSEQTVHQARELGLDYFAAGHHATERGGVEALGAHLAARFGLEHRFINIENPA
jgi:dinuclear metal center YbgI/SA1388 family protein